MSKLSLRYLTMLLFTTYCFIFAANASAASAFDETLEECYFGIEARAGFPEGTTQAYLKNSIRSNIESFPDHLKMLSCASTVKVIRNGQTSIFVNDTVYSITPDTVKDHAFHTWLSKSVLISINERISDGKPLSLEDYLTFREQSMFRAPKDVRQVSEGLPTVKVEFAEGVQKKIDGVGFLVLFANARDAGVVSWQLPFAYSLEKKLGDLLSSVESTQLPVFKEFVSNHKCIYFDQQCQINLEKSKEHMLEYYSVVSSMGLTPHGVIRDMHGAPGILFADTYMFFVLKKYFGVKDVKIMVNGQEVYSYAKTLNLPKFLTAKYFNAQLDELLLNFTASAKEGTLSSVPSTDVSVDPRLD